MTAVEQNKMLTREFPAGSLARLIQLLFRHHFTRQLTRYHFA